MSASNFNGSSAAASLLNSPTPDQLVQLFLTVNPINGEQRLRQILSALGVTDPTKLTSDKKAKFKDTVFRSAEQQAGIKDPGAWIANQAELMAKAAAASALRRGSSAETGGNHAGQPKSPDDRPPVAPVKAPSTSASAPRAAARAPMWGASKAEVLSGAKAAIEAGENPRRTAERLACAHDDFHASLREIGRVTGIAASSVSRLLKWRRSGCPGSSPYGPTTRAGRAARRDHTISDRSIPDQPNITVVFYIEF